MAYDLSYLSMWSGDTEVSVNTTNYTAVVDCGGATATFGYQDQGSFMPSQWGYVTFRMIYGTDATFATYEGESSTWSQYIVSEQNSAITATDITLSVGTVDTTYYYRMEATTGTTGGTWMPPNSPPYKGQFDIGSVVAAVPTINLSAYPFLDNTFAPNTLHVNAENMVDATAWTITWTNATDTLATRTGTYDLAYGDAYLNVLAAVAGTYTATIFATNAVGSTTESWTTEMTTPTVGATFTWASATVSANQRTVVATITDSSTISDSYDAISQRLWTITKPDASTMTFSNVVSCVATFGTNTTDCGNYGVTLSVTTVKGATSNISNTQAFTVNYLTPVATFSAFPTIGDVTFTNTFYNDSTGDWGSCKWDFGDTSTSTSTSATVTHSWTTNSYWTISLTVTGLDTTATSVATRTNYILGRTNTYGQTLEGFLEEIKNHLLENPSYTVCDAFSEFGGVDNVLSLYYRRLWDFLKRTAILRAETSITATADGLYNLTTDCIRVMRVEANGYKINPMDRKQADWFDSDWESTTSGDIQGWIMEPEESLTLRLVPAVTTATLTVQYVQATTAITTTPTGCSGWAALPMPYALTWAVKWGVIADLLSQEGEMNDPVRARMAEQLYEAGVTAAQLLSTKRATK